MTLARVHLARGRADDALALLREELPDVARSGRTGTAIEAHMLLALAHRRLGDVRAACDELEPALALAEPEGYVRLFTDEGAPMADLLARLLAGRARRRGAGGRAASAGYIRRLLAASGAAPAADGPAAAPADAAPLAEALSAREREIVRHIAAGRSNEEIARALVVATSTVKWHASNIYGKLGVHGRMLAALRARELGLI